MTLREVLDGVPQLSEIPVEVASASVDGLAYDSRKVKPGFVFFAFPGSHVDGRKFASDALAAGALAIVSELSSPEAFPGCWIQVRHGRQALATAAGNFYGHPDRRLGLTGITGTNGKTTTAFLIDSILRAAGFTTAMVGTIEYRLAGKPRPAVNTTPESLDLFELFSDLEKAGGTHATMETSSHALALGRVHGIHYHTAVFTNLTRDHLDFHKTMDEYFAAKQLLFTGQGAAAPRFAVINHDDAYGRALQTNPASEVFWYGLEEGATTRAHAIASDFQGLHFEIHHGGRHHRVESSLVGQINVYNILAAWCTGLSYGLAPEVIARGIQGLPRRARQV
jgi:UDP-N-acetylmuramyl-tripeptide synthetase